MEDSQADYTERLWDLLAPDDGALPTPIDLKEAETLARESFEWASIASGWLDVHGIYGASNVAHCARRAQVCSRFCAGTLSIVDAWLRIAAFDASYCQDALFCMNMAEADLDENPCATDACQCAKT